jgi:hypothetical protein
MDDEFEEGLKEWTKQYSQSRKRDYFFNNKTGESLWTLDEVRDKVRRQIKRARGEKMKAIVDKQLTDPRLKPSTSKVSNLQQESFSSMIVDDDCEPMDIEIVENVTENAIVYN